MESQTNENNIRDGDSPRADISASSSPVASGRNQMFRRSSRLAGLQAGTVKLATAMNNCGSLFVSESDLISELDSSAHFNLESKSCSEELQQDIPHSSVTDSSRESSSDDFASSFQTKYQHESRDSNLRNNVINYSRKPK